MAAEEEEEGEGEAGLLGLGWPGEEGAAEEEEGVEEGREEGQGVVAAEEPEALAPPGPQVGGG